MLSKLAIRNIFRNRRRSTTTLFVIIFGVVALVLFGGYKTVTFRGLRESTIRNRLGHLQIYGQGYSNAKSPKPLEFGLENTDAVRRAIERDPRVTMTAAQISLMGLVSNGEKSETFMATAVEPSKDEAMSKPKLVAGSFISDKELDGVILGRGLAASLNAKPGDYLTIMTTTVAGGLNAMDVRVAGIFVTGVKEYDDRAVKMPLAAAQQLLQTKKVERLLVMLHQTDDTQAVKSDLTALFAKNRWQLELKDWFQLATYYHQVVMLYNGIFGFLGIVVFAIVIFSVANTMMMSIFERTREIGTMMAMGTTAGRIRRMFVLEGFSLGVFGAILGLASGWIVSQLINHGNVILPPPPGYTAGYKLTILIAPSVVITAAFIAIVTPTLSALVPAFRASRMKIVDALGHI